MDFDPCHAVAAIGRGLDRTLNRLVKTRPAGTALELRVGGEERLSAGRARESARTVFVVEWAGTGALRTMLAEHVELLGRERLFPFGVGFLRHAAYSSTALDTSLLVLNN